MLGFTFVYIFYWIFEWIIFTTYSWAVSTLVLFSSKYYPCQDERLIFFLEELQMTFDYKHQLRIKDTCIHDSNGRIWRNLLNQSAINDCVNKHEYDWTVVSFWVASFAKLLASWQPLQFFLVEPFYLVLNTVFKVIVDQSWGCSRLNIIFPWFYTKGQENKFV